MSEPVRARGKYGRRTPKQAPALELKSFLKAGITASAVPAHPASEDYLATLKGWNMLGNDVAGDCVAVTWANFRRLVTKYAGSEYYPTQEQVWEVYRTQNPDFDPSGSASGNGPGSASDQGMDIQTVLEYLVKQGGPDGVKAVAFAKVDFTNRDELEAALAIFGGLWVGIDVIQANMTEFDHGKPWDYVAGSPEDGGHSVLAGGYTPNVKFITWAAETSFTDSFRTHLFGEVWVVIWPEHLTTAQFQAGIDINALATAYQQITGKTFPVPAPAPSPAPTPAPVPAPVPVPAPASGFPVEVYALFKKHPMKYKKQLESAIDAWLAEGAA